MLVYHKKIIWHKNVWPGHNLVFLSFCDDKITIRSYEKIPKELQEAARHHYGESMVWHSVAELTGDPSRTEIAHELPTIKYKLDQFRTHPQFKDLSTFGIGGDRQDFMYANIDPGKQTFPSFGDFQMVEGYPFSLIFPDTESSFADAVLLIPDFTNGEMEIHHDGMDMGKLKIPHRMLSSKKLPVMALTFPTLTLTGPVEAEAGSIVELDVSMTDSQLEYGSIYRVTATCDNGFLPLRVFQLGADEIRTLKLDTSGLMAGDVVRVKAGIDADASLAECKIRLV